MHARCCCFSLLNGDMSYQLSLWGLRLSFWGLRYLISLNAIKPMGPTVILLGPTVMLLGPTCFGLNGNDSNRTRCDVVAKKKYQIIFWFVFDTQYELEFCEVRKSFNRLQKASRVEFLLALYRPILEYFRIFWNDFFKYYVLGVCITWCTCWVSSLHDGSNKQQQRYDRQPPPATVHADIHMQGNAAFFWSRLIEAGWCI